MAHLFKRARIERNASRYVFDISKGRAVGSHLAEELWRALSRSQAVKTGLVKDLEDTVLLVEGIGPDNISDITINIILKPLAQLTKFH